MPPEVFREFRISCVHLRREREALDALAEKEVAWRFLCRLLRRPCLRAARQAVPRAALLARPCPRGAADLDDERSLDEGLRGGPRV